MKIHKAKGWWWGVIKSVGETNHGMNRETIKLGPDLEKGKTYSVISAKKQGI